MAAAPQRDVGKAFKSGSPLNSVGLLCSVQTKEQWSVPINATIATQNVLKKILNILWLPAFKDGNARDYAARFNYCFAPDSFGHINSTAAMYAHGKGLFEYFDEGIKRAQTAEDKQRMRACQSVAVTVFVNGIYIEKLVPLKNKHHIVTIGEHKW